MDVQSAPAVITEKMNQSLSLLIWICVPIAIYRSKNRGMTFLVFMGSALALWATFIGLLLLFQPRASGALEDVAGEFGVFVAILVAFWHSEKTRNAFALKQEVVPPQTVGPRGAVRADGMFAPASPPPQYAAPPIVTPVTTDATKSRAGGAQRRTAFLYAGISILLFAACAGAWAKKYGLELPEAQHNQLHGALLISRDTLYLDVYNGSTWRLKEVELEVDLKATEYYPKEHRVYVLAKECRSLQSVQIKMPAAWDTEGRTYTYRLRSSRGWPF